LLHGINERRSSAVQAYTRVLSAWSSGTSELISDLRTAVFQVLLHALVRILRLLIYSTFLTRYTMCFNARTSTFCPVFCVRFRKTFTTNSDCINIKIFVRNAVFSLRCEINLYISFICDKSVTTQNLAFLSYWYRKKRLQMHF
jgi:hypothetical protein